MNLKTWEKALKFWKIDTVKNMILKCSEIYPHRFLNPLFYFAFSLDLIFIVTETVTTVFLFFLNIYILYFKKKKANDSSDFALKPTANIRKTCMKLR